MDNPAIIALKREMDAANEKVAALTAELRDLKVSVKSYESAIEQLGGAVHETPNRIAPRASRAGERLEDRILAEIQAANGTNARLLATKLTDEGRRTGETTVSSLISRLKKDGKIVRRDDGLFYGVGWPPPIPNNSMNMFNPNDSRGLSDLDDL
jgi:chromosome segregation ATPase